MNWLIRKLFLVKEIISQEGEIHFRRYRLLGTPWFNIYLHEIRHSDEDRHMHDHPWNYTSFILKGSYFEQRMFYPNFRVMGSGTYGPQDLLERDSRDVHRLTIKSPVVWTLVITSGRERVWGYQTSQGWIDFKTYRQLKRAGQLPQ